MSPEFRNPIINTVYQSIQSHRDLVARSLGFPVRSKNDVSKFGTKTLEIKNIPTKGYNDTEVIRRNYTITYQETLSESGQLVPPARIQKLINRLGIGKPGNYQGVDPETAWRLLEEASRRTEQDGVEQVLRESLRAGNSLKNLALAVEGATGGRYRFVAGSFKVQTGAGLLPKEVRQQISAGKIRPAQLFDRMDPDFQLHITMLNTRTISGAEGWRMGYHNMQGNIIYKDNDGDWEEIWGWEDENGNFKPFTSNWPFKGEPNMAQSVALKGISSFQHIKIHHKTHEEVISEELSYLAGFSVRKLFDPKGPWLSAYRPKDQAPFDKWLNSIFVAKNESIKALYPSRNTIWRDLEKAAGSKAADIGLLSVELQNFVAGKVMEDYLTLGSSAKAKLNIDPAAKSAWIKQRWMLHTTTYAEEVKERGTLAKGEKSLRAREVSHYNQLLTSQEKILLTGKYTVDPTNTEAGAMLVEKLMAQADGDFSKGVWEAAAGFDILDPANFRTVNRLRKRKPGIRPIEYPKEGNGLFEALTNPVFEAESGQKFAILEFHNLNIHRSYLPENWGEDMKTYAALVRRDMFGKIRSANGPRVENTIDAPIFMPIFSPGVDGGLIIKDPWEKLKEIMDMMGSEAKINGRTFGTLKKTDTVEFLLSKAGTQELSKLAAASNKSPQEIAALLINSGSPEGVVQRLRLSYDMATYHGTFQAIWRKVNETMGSLTRTAPFTVAKDESTIYSNEQVQRTIGGTFLMDFGMRFDDESLQLAALKQMESRYFAANGFPMFSGMRKRGDSDGFQHAIMHAPTKKVKGVDIDLPFTSFDAKALTQKLYGMQTDVNVAVYMHQLPPEFDRFYREAASKKNRLGQALFEEGQTPAQSMVFLTAQGQELEAKMRRNHRGHVITSPVETVDTPNMHYDAATGETIWYSTGGNAIEDPSLKLFLPGIKAQPFSLNAYGRGAKSGESVEVATTLNTLLTRAGFVENTLIPAIMKKRGISMSQAVALFSRAREKPEELIEFFDSLTEPVFYTPHSTVRDGLERDAIEDQSGRPAMIFRTSMELINSESERRPPNLSRAIEMAAMGEYTGESAMFQTHQMAESLARLSFLREKGDDLAWMGTTDPQTGNMRSLEFLNTVSAQLTKQHMAEVSGNYFANQGAGLGSVLMAQAEGMLRQGESSAKVAGWLEFMSTFVSRL